jgi:hypothetical protein
MLGPSRIERSLGGIVSASVWHMWISRALAVVAVVAAAVALVGLTTGSWAMSTFQAQDRGTADPGPRLDVEMFPDGHLGVPSGDAALRQLYDSEVHSASREALSLAVPSLLDGFAIYCVVVIGLLAAVGVFRRLPPYLWTVAAAVAMGALTAVTVLRTQLLSALGTYSVEINLASDVEVHGQPLAGRTVAVIVVFLIAAVASAHPALREPPDAEDR